MQLGMGLYKDSIKLLLKLQLKFTQMRRFSASGILPLLRAGAFTCTIWQLLHITRLILHCHAPERFARSPQIQHRVPSKALQAVCIWPPPSTLHPPAPPS